MAGDVRRDIEFVLKAQDKTKAGFKSAEQSIKKVASATEAAAAKQKLMNDLFGEFASKGAAFIGADILARVVGFTNLMDALQKTAQKVATTIRETLRLDLIDFSTTLSKTRDQVKSIREELALLEKERRKDERTVGTFTFDIGEVTDLGKRQEALLLLAEFGDRFSQIDKDLQKLRATSNRVGRLGDVSGARGPDLIRAANRAAFDQTLLLDQLDERFRALVDSTKASSQAAKEAAIETTAAALAQTEWNKALADAAESREDQERIERLAANWGLLTVNITAAVAAAQQFAARRVEADADTAVIAGRRSNDARLGRLAGGGVLQAHIATGIAQSAIEARREADALAESMERAAENAQNLFERGQAQDFFGGLRDGAKDAAEALSSPRDFGGALGAGVVNSLSGAIERVFLGIQDGSIKAKDAFKEFTRSLLLNISQLITQLIALKLAQQAVGFIFSGGGLGSSSGGIGRGLDLADPPIKPINVGGGDSGGITMVFNAGSNRESVLAALPDIERALSRSIGSGRTRSLNVAVRGA